jgi:hypothetical protein
VREWIAGRAPERSEDEVRALARASAGRLDRARRLLDPAAAGRREFLIAAARAVYLDPGFDPGDAAATLLAAADERGQEAKEREQAAIEGLEFPAREAEQRVRRAQRGAEREELLAGLEALEAWFRDLVVVGARAEQAAVHADRLGELQEDAARELGDGPVRAAEEVRETWRALEEFNLNPSLALEALFVRLERVVGGLAARS